MERFLIYRKRLTRYMWDLHRFGLMPSKWLARIFNQREPRIVVISIPKAGTHLVERILCLHPRLYRPLLPTLHPNNIDNFGGLERVLQNLRSGGILITHLHYTKQIAKVLKDSGVKVVVVVRDPRDVVVSNAFYIANNKKHYYHAHMQGLSLEDQLRRVILGDPERNLLSIAQTLEEFAGWLDTGNLVIHFEDIISSERRYETIKNLFSYLEMEVKEDLLEQITNNVISEASPTFRKGASGEWRKYLKGDLYKLFLDTAGTWMSKYDYSNKDTFNT